MISSNIKVWRYFVFHQQENKLIGRMSSFIRIVIVQINVYQTAIVVRCSLSSRLDNPMHYFNVYFLLCILQREKMSRQRSNRTKSSRMRVWKNKSENIISAIGKNILIRLVKSVLYLCYIYIYIYKPPYSSYS